MSLNFGEFVAVGSMSAAVNMVAALCVMCLVPSSQLERKDDERNRVYWFFFVFFLAVGALKLPRALVFFQLLSAPK